MSAAIVSFKNFKKGPCLFKKNYTPLNEKDERELIDIYQKPEYFFFSFKKKYANQFHVLHIPYIRYQ